LIAELIDGETSISDPELQSTLLDWMASIDYNLFRNTETGDDYYAMCCRRGNVVYATRKTNKEKEIRDALEGKEFDFPVTGFRNRRMTRLLFVTLNFDREQFTMEEAWAALRSTLTEGTEYLYNVINRFNANIRKIFGPHGTLVAKEAQSSGYPAPHIIFVLDEPVMVEYRESKGKGSWRLCDPRILRRIGKDPQLRRLTFKDHRKAMKLNPIWKYGFCDFEGIIAGDRFKNRKDAISYPFKYLTKCLTDADESRISGFDTINEIEDKSIRTMLFTHLGNKCFCTRDVSFGKSFKERIGMLPTIKPEGQSVWKRIETVTGSQHDLVMELKQRKAVKLFRSVCSKQGSLSIPT